MISPLNDFFLYNLFMRDFIRDKSWEDWLIYSAGIIILIGLFLFTIGYLWSFTMQTDIFPNEDNVKKTNIRELLKGTSYDEYNLFTLIGAINKDITPKFFNMTVLAISGFTFIMFGIAQIFSLILFTIIYEWVWPPLKKIIKNKT